MYFVHRGSATGVSCYKILSTSPPKFLELSPRVAVVTGINSATGFLYGISNNGLAYVISKDGGTTWTSITDDIYTNVVADPLFIQATVS
uniref:Sortilin N-terminal domain-containing protein n=1 Tax=Arion vulgaris TaxID=1028688 RepID=A0A0B7C2I7_9EUPU